MIVLVTQEVEVTGDVDEAVEALKTYNAPHQDTACWKSAGGGWTLKTGRVVSVRVQKKKVLKGGE